MEKRVLFGPESASSWSVAESSLQASARQTRTSQPVLHWHIPVDHFAGEANYPIGWPRISIVPREASAQNWSDWDYLDLWIHASSSRQSLPREPMGLALYTPDKAAAYHRPLRELKQNAWTRIRIPLSDIPRHHNVRLIQFHVSESNYRHQDQLDFLLDEIALLRYAQPAFVEFAAEQAVLFADTRQIPLRFNVAGIKQGERVALTCRLKTGGRMVEETKTEVPRGLQRHSLEVRERSLRPGSYQIEGWLGGAREPVVAEVRVIESPWR